MSSLDRRFGSRSFCRSFRRRNGSSSLPCTCSQARRRRLADGLHLNAGRLRFRLRLSGQLLILLVFALLFLELDAFPRGALTGCCYCCRCRRSRPFRRCRTRAREPPRSSSSSGSSSSSSRRGWRRRQSCLRSGASLSARRVRSLGSAARPLSRYFDRLGLGLGLRLRLKLGFRLRFGRRHWLISRRDTVLLFGAFLPNALLLLNVLLLGGGFRRSGLDSLLGSTSGLLRRLGRGRIGYCWLLLLILHVNGGGGGLSLERYLGNSRLGRCGCCCPARSSSRGRLGRLLRGQSSLRRFGASTRHPLRG